MAQMRIEYNIRHNWTITQKNFVGPTADLGFRPVSALPHPPAQNAGRNDANTIYVDALLGDDAQSGNTLATAKRTLDQAIAAVDSNANKHTIHIETAKANIKYTQVLLRSLASPAGNYAIIPANLRHIQVAAGQTATVVPTVMDDLSSTFLRKTSAGGLVFHGFDIRTQDSIRYPQWWLECNESAMQFEPTGLRVEWCAFATEGTPIHQVGGIGPINGVVVIKNSILETTGARTIRGVSYSESSRRILSCIQFPRHQDWDIQQSIFISGGTSCLNRDGVTSSIRIALTIGQSIFRCPGGAAIRMGYVNAFGSTWDVRTSIFDDVLQLVRVIHAPVGLMSFHKCLINAGSAGGFVDVSDPSNKFNADPLFINAAGGDYRLWHVAEGYEVNSPGIGMGEPPFGDAGAYRIDRTYNGETYDIIDFPEGFIFEPFINEFIRKNYAENESLRGEKILSWDMVRDRLVIQAPEELWVGGDFALKLKRLFKATGKARFYPNSLPFSGEPERNEGSILPPITWSQKLGTLGSVGVSTGPSLALAGSGLVAVTVTTGGGASPLPPKTFFSFDQNGLYTFDLNGRIPRPLVPDIYVGWCIVLINNVGPDLPLVRTDLMIVAHSEYEIVARAFRTSNIATAHSKRSSFGIAYLPVVITGESLQVQSDYYAAWGAGADPAISPFYKDVNDTVEGIPEDGAAHEFHVRSFTLDWDYPAESGQFDPLEIA